MEINHKHWQQAFTIWEPNSLVRSSHQLSNGGRRPNAPTIATLPDNSLTDHRWIIHAEIQCKHGKEVQQMRFGVNHSKCKLHLSIGTRMTTRISSLALTESAGSWARPLPGHTRCDTHLWATRASPGWWAPSACPWLCRWRWTGWACSAAAAAPRCWCRPSAAGRGRRRRTGPPAHRSPGTGTRPSCAPLCLRCHWAGCQRRGRDGQLSVCVWGGVFSTHVDCSGSGFWMPSWVGSSSQ